MISAIFRLNWLLLFVFAPVAYGQEKGPEYSAEPAMNYSSDTPAWLAFVAKSRSAKGSSWWPDWTLPSWQSSKAPGWWSSSKKVSSYSRSNKTTMQKLSQTSKRWWNSTVEFLDPYAPPKERQSNARSEGGYFGKWFGGGGSEPKFNSVPEWAAQPMPK